jgi:hypothetical protein
LIEYADKILKNWVMRCLRQHRGKIAAGPAEASSSVPRPFRLIVRPDMNQVAKERSRDNARSEKFHDSQDEFPGVIHRLGNAVQKRVAR